MNTEEEKTKFTSDSLTNRLICAIMDLSKSEKEELLKFALEFLKGDNYEG